MILSTAALKKQFNILENTLIHPLCQELLEKTDTIFMSVCQINSQSVQLSMKTRKRWKQLVWIRPKVAKAPNQHYFCFTHVCRLQTSCFLFACQVSYEMYELTKLSMENSKKYTDKNNNHIYNSTREIVGKNWFCSLHSACQYLLRPHGLTKQGCSTLYLNMKL